MAGKVSVTNLTKSFPIGRRPGLRERLAGKGRKRDRRKILNGISFEVTPGEVIGIIGRNGAGKSTLLKLLAGIYSSDDGKIVTQGRIASLLELGAGFHPELTGMENIRLNGSLLGMSGKEIDRKEKMILDFAELEAFAEDQIKTYSAGMILRLAFSVAMALDPDIFLLDEIIGVGDLAFQRKCFSRISELKSEGKTILFVSHNLSIMRFFAEKIMWIEDGRVEGFGNKHQVLDRYRERLSSSGGDVSRMEGGGRRFGDGPLVIDSVTFRDSTGGKNNLFRYGEPFVIEIDVGARGVRTEETAVLTLQFHTDFGTDLVGPLFHQVSIPGNGPWTFRYEIPKLPLLRREFLVSVGVYEGESLASPSDQREKGFRFSVLDTGGRTAMGLIDPGGSWDGPL